MNLKVITLSLLFCFSALLYGQSQKQYIFFLHNKFLEDHTFNEKHPKYGIAEYKAIISKLEDKNTIVISEKRKPDTDIKAYAMKVKKQIDSLYQKGIPIRNITIVGTSQGGYIAQYVSYYMKNPELKFVFVGASFNDDSLNRDDNFRLYGKVLSINESSDNGSKPLSGQKRFINSKLNYFKEIELNTGLAHGFLFKALDEWILPAKEWAKEKK
ncbi:alpha/beta hydrolase [Elizabethkingia ursingii]|uniref:alpha/beta hydrolase n=1 Tax=Elizabethkingia ursingii TaxID=1756150 RepID=UPI0020134E20|nr:alpha/beta hydrolase [Elizabethkingia ursingii]MCL1669811.1 alpha/beta hydrolase [Elizabethkingia ursingii]